MRDFSEMMATIKGVAQKLNVLAIAQNGSRTNKLAPVDQWQDFDIVYVVPDVAPYVNDQRWLADFGELLIMQQPDSRDFLQGTQTTRYHFLLQFADGNRIDLTFLAQSDVAAWAAEDTLAEIFCGRTADYAATSTGNRSDALGQTADVFRFFRVLQRIFLGSALCRQRFGAWRAALRHRSLL